MPTLVSSGISNATQIINWVNDIGNPLIVAGYSTDPTPVPQIVIDNHLVISNFVVDNNVRIYYDGTQIRAIGASYGVVKSIIVIHSTDFVCVELVGKYDGVNVTCRCLVLYSKSTGSTLYGAVHFEYGRVADGVIENMTITDADTNDAYSLQTIFKTYTLATAHLDYTQKRLFKNGVKSTTILPDFLDCSTIDPFKIVSFSGSSYYSAGYNTLIKVTIAQ